MSQWVNDCADVEFLTSLTSRKDCLSAGWGGWEILVLNIPKLKRLHAACTSERCIESSSMFLWWTVQMYLTHHLKRWGECKVNESNNNQTFICKMHIYVFPWCCICHVGGPHWSDSELWKSQLLQGVYSGLLLRGAAASSFWTVRHLQWRPLWHETRGLPWICGV